LLFLERFVCCRMVNSVDYSWKDPNPIQFLICLLQKKRSRQNM
jgi:hypothetical protein